MLNEITATAYFKKLTIGSTNPFIANTQNESYVCKLYESDLGNLHLVNEYVCYHLAKLVNLPIPEANLIRFTQDTISTSDDLSTRDIKSTLAFGSRLINRVQTNITPILLESCDNTSIIPSLILFDQIILNYDRATNDGNLLFNTKKRELIVIDHSHVFNVGTIWTEYSLSQCKDQLLVNNFQKKYYKMLNRYIYGHNPFGTVIDKISMIKLEDIESIVNSVPDEWEFDSTSANALISFIMHRLNLIPNILAAISDECPQWKGAI